VKQLLACVSDIDTKKILVLFNGEIVEGLINSKKVDPKNSVFGVDDAKRLRAEFIEAMYPGVSTCVFTNKDPKSIREALGNKKWDVVVSNPPYNRGLDLKILLALMEGNVAKEYVVVHPSRWLIDRKGTSLYDTMKEKCVGKLKSAKLFNGNAVFGIELFIPCVISHIDVNYDNELIKVEIAIRYKCVISKCRSRNRQLNLSFCSFIKFINSCL
jgi:hypothetical protein